MITGFAPGFHAAGLFFLEIVDEFRDDGFFNAKLFLTRMRQARVNAG
jgi:hypothetical protein